MGLNKWIYGVGFNKFDISVLAEMKLKWIYRFLRGPKVCGIMKSDYPPIYEFIFWGFGCILKT